MAVPSPDHGKYMPFCSGLLIDFYEMVVRTLLIMQIEFCRARQLDVYLFRSHNPSRQ